MTAISNINELLASLSPELLPGEYVFSSVPGKYGDYTELSPLASFEEKEGLTIVIEKQIADQRGISYSSSFKAITLSVHSSLEAVGFTAAVASKLAEKGIAANIIAACFHDHVFVPVDRAEAAVAALLELTRRDGG